MIHESCTFKGKNSFAKGGKTRINGIAQLNKRRVSQPVTDYDDEKNKENYMKNKKNPRKRKGIFGQINPSKIISNADNYD